MKSLFYLFISLILSMNSYAHEVVKIGDTMDKMRELHGIETRVTTIEPLKGNEENIVSVHYYDNYKITYIYDNGFVCKIIIGTSRELSQESEWCDVMPLNDKN